VTPRVIAIVGPTAVGKTSIALTVAEATGSEIVSLDSMQVYRGMDIGTDKVSADVRARIPHHMIDVLDPNEDLTVAEFQSMARAAISEIVGRGKMPLLVGGSGLYLRAVIDDLRFPPTSPEVRASLEEELETVGVDGLYERLQALDPVAAAKIEAANGRRTVRALEVIALTGRPFSENASWETYESIYDVDIVGLERPRDDLFARIDRRVDEMLDRGLIQEARSLAAAGMSRTARQALGYRQVLEAPSESSKEQIGAAIISATKRFARRQEAWFRADPRITWLDADDPDEGRNIADLLAGMTTEGR
jgi:tRNA dimethylallyltransferase